jgi:hypothetical protein
VAVVVVVPAGQRENHPVAGVDDGPVGGVDERARAAGNQQVVGAVVQALAGFQKRRNTLTQLAQAGGGRVIGLPGLVGLGDAGVQARRNGKNGGVEIANGQVADVGSLAHLLAYLVADSNDFGAAQAGRHLRYLHGRNGG